MLDGFDVTITQSGHVFTVTGKDVERLYDKLRKKADSHFVTGSLENGSFTLEKIAHVPAQHVPAQMASVG